MTKTKKIKCPNEWHGRICGYVWETKSKLSMVTCPSCLQKVDSVENEMKEVKEK